MKAWKKNIMYCTYEMNEWATMRAFWFGFSQTGQIEEGGGHCFPVVFVRRHYRSTYYLDIHPPLTRNVMKIQIMPAIVARLTSCIVKKKKKRCRWDTADFCAGPTPSKTPTLWRHKASSLLRAEGPSCRVNVAGYQMVQRSRIIIMSR